MATLLEEIAKRIKEFDDREKEQIEAVRPKPRTIDKYDVPPFIVPKTRDKKQINEFRKILTFIRNKAQPLRQRDTCTIMPISSTSKDLRLIWSNVYRGRELMKKIGLIRPFNEDYKMSGKHTYAKLYMYFYENEVKFVDYCKQNNIKVLEPTLKTKHINTVNNLVDESKVKIGKGLYINKPDNYTVPEFEEVLLEIFKKNYPEYQEYSDMVDDINEKYYKDRPEFQIKFKPSFHWNSKHTRVMKIGFRATNDKCNEKKEERPNTLEKNRMALEFDVNGSVPRLNSSMNLGHWNDDPTDIYKVIFHECYPNEEFTESARNAIKELLLRAYFEKTSNLLARDVWNAITHDSLDKKMVEQEMNLLDAAIKKTVGPEIYGQEIYYIEGCVYLSVLKELLDDGHFVWFLYDGLYSTGVMMDELFKAMVEQIIKYEFDIFYKKYIGNRVRNV